MNLIPLTAGLSAFDTSEEDPLFDFFLGQGFSVNNSDCAEFLSAGFGRFDEEGELRSGGYEYQEEAFNMQQLLINQELVGGFTPNPAYPGVVSLDLQQPITQLYMYTNNLRVLAAPAELCVKKALEFISSRLTYELSLETFRMELLQDVLAGQGETEVNALIKGIRCLADYILAYFDNLTKSNADLFPYEFYCLHLGRYLFLSKIVIDGSLPSVRPATIHFPSSAYPEVQARARADYITQADQCLIL